MSAVDVLFAPVLRAEGWFSIELQERNILDALRAHPAAPRLHVIAPGENAARLPLGKQWLRDIRYPAMLRARAARLGRCVLHVTDQSYGHLCRAHQPCVANCNDLHHLVAPELSGTRLRRWQRRVRGLTTADKVIAVSHHLAGEIREHLGLPDERIVVIHGGVDTSQFGPMAATEAAARLPSLAALRKDHLVVLNVGSNLHRKNLPTLLRALRLLVAENRQPVILVKVGPALRGSEYEPLIRELDLANAIVDAGQLGTPDVAAAYRLAHALAFPSVYEGFGRPTLEAQASGLPVVLADASCMREIGGRGAVYHAPTSAEELAQALAQVMTNDEIRQPLIAAGRENAAQFTWSRYADQLVAVYQSVLP